MIKPIMKDVLFLAQKSEPATAKDKNIAIKLTDIFIKIPSPYSLLKIDCQSTHFLYVRQYEITNAVRYAKYTICTTTHFCNQSGYF